VFSRVNWLLVGVFPSELVARGWFFEGKICDLCKVVVYLQAKR
jgi:uncharacterized membrane protein YuzA (DUF378 family)